MAGPWDKYAPQGGPWDQYAPVTANPNLTAQGLAAEGVRAGNFINQRDPGIDYSSGVDNAMLRAGFSGMKNEKEKANYLNLRVGQGNWDKDNFGALYIKPAGLKRIGINAVKPVAFDEQRTTAYDLADVAGDAPAVAGAVGMGMAASGLGAIPGMALSGLGAAGGRAFDEIAKNLQGLQRNDAKGVATDLAKEAGLAMLGEGLVRGAAPIVNKLASPGAKFMTPEKKAAAESAIDQGFKIRAGSVTDAPILARWEGMVQKIFGDLYEPQNVAAAKSGSERLLTAAGKPSTPEAAGEAVSKSIKANRVKFSEDIGKLYSRVDELVGGQPIVPTHPLKEQAKQALEALPKTADGKIIGGKDKFVTDILQMGDFMTVQQAQRLRTMLREASESPDLIPDVSMHDARLLKGAVNDAFEAAKSAAPKGANEQQAINMLRAADAQYAAGIRKFDNPVVTAITKDASRPGAVEPEMIVDYLIKPDRAVRIRRVKEAVSSTEWEKVKAAHANDLLSTVIKGTDDPLKSVFDGRAFRDSLDKYGRNTLEEVHGKEWVDQAYKYAGALMLANKKMGLSGGIVAANIALHPLVNLPKLIWLRSLAKVMEQPGTFKYLTEGIRLGPETKAGAAALGRVASQLSTLANDETGSARVTFTAPEAN